MFQFLNLDNTDEEEEEDEEQIQNKFMTEYYISQFFHIKLLNLTTNHTFVLISITLLIW